MKFKVQSSKFKVQTLKPQALSLKPSLRIADCGLRIIRTLCGICLICGLLCALCVSVVKSQDKLALTENEFLKHENLTLRLDSTQKQMALLERQYRDLAEQTTRLQTEIKESERAILKAHGADGGAIDWQARKVIPNPAQPEKKAEGKKPQ